MGLSVKEFRGHCRIAYSKVVEFQARGLVHVHVPIRLDGPDGPDGDASDLQLPTADLEAAIKEAAAVVRLKIGPLTGGAAYELGLGRQVDCRAISETAQRDGPRTGSVAHPERVAAYLAKYLTKTTEDFGYARLRDNYATLGYRGHPITKSRGYSVTFGQPRRARREYKKHPGLDPAADIRRLLDEDADVPNGFELVSSWVYVGRGYLDLEQAAAAIRSASIYRTRRPGDHSSAASR